MLGEADISKLHVYETCRLPALPLRSALRFNMHITFDESDTPLRFDGATRLSAYAQYSYFQAALASTKMTPQALACKVILLCSLSLPVCSTSAPLQEIRHVGIVTHTEFLNPSFTVYKSRIILNKEPVSAPVPTCRLPISKWFGLSHLFVLRRC